MRVWIFNIDGILAADAINGSTTLADPACGVLIRSLAEQSSDQVVIVSHRNIYDIAERISIPGAIIGGCNGMQWQLPSGYLIGAFRDHGDDLVHCRLKILPELNKIVSGAGIEMDDKLWSVSVDTSRITYNAWISVENKICAWALKYGLTVTNGLDQIDIQLIPGFNKSQAISYLARILKIDPDVDPFIYAGGDESDAAAMWWTIFFGGTAIMVGNDLQVPGAEYVQDSSGLINMIDTMVKIP